MRITQAMTTRMVLSDLETVSNQLGKTQQRISSGKQLTTPSDDSFATSRALQLRSDLDEVAQYGRNVSEASSWQSATDSALSSISDLTLRARELTVQAANGTLSSTGRAAISAELEQLIQGIKSEANAQYGGRYIFSGTQTSTAPYSQADDAYHGDAGGINREIGRGVQVQVNVTGSAVVGDDTGGLIAGLRAVQTHLAAADPVAALQGDLAAIDAAHDQLTNVRAGVGALGNRLQAAGDRLGALQESATKLLSDTEDADMAKTLIDYSTQQAVYQAALKAGANLIQPSLLDFLR
jgi:flagellar hook-associated protein 3 FlgL